VKGDGWFKPQAEGALPAPDPPRVPAARSKMLCCAKPLHAHLQHPLSLAPLVQHLQESLNKADALYYHLPTFSGLPRAKAFPNQLRVALSLEASSITPHVADPTYMCHFDAEWSFRTCAQVTG
jgi:hypothetical protein